MPEMPLTPSLSFRKLAPEETELALSLAASVNADDPYSESFGVSDPMPVPGGDAWGLWIGGGLSGAAWLSAAPGGPAEVTALALARSWLRLELAAWMLGELVGAAAAAGCSEVTLTVRKGGSALAGVLLDAGFSGPDVSDGGAPLGKWSRKCLPI